VVVELVKLRYNSFLLSICNSLAFWKGVAKMLVDLVDFAADQSKLSNNRKSLPGGVREWWLNWLS